MSKEEFTSDKIKDALEKWVGPIEDLEAEFEAIDTNSGGQVITYHTFIRNSEGLIRYSSLIGKITS